MALNLIITAIFTAFYVLVPIIKVAIDAAEAKKFALELSQSLPHNHFSASRYLAHMEQIALEELEKTEKEPRYIITLWWGLDGLKLNEDGMTEWVSRRTQKAPCKATPYIYDGSDWYNLTISDSSRDMYGNIIRRTTQAQNLCDPMSLTQIDSESMASLLRLHSLNSVQAWQAVNQGFEGADQ